MKLGALLTKSLAVMAFNSKTLELSNLLDGIKPCLELVNECGRLGHWYPDSICLEANGLEVMLKLTQKLIDEQVIVKIFMLINYKRYYIRKSLIIN